MQYLSFSISIIILSWIVAMILNEFIKKTVFYNNLSNLNFIKSERMNKLIGIGLFKWVVKNTFFKYFNQKLKLQRKIEITQLIELRKEMTTSEINHLIGFTCVSIYVLVKLFTGNYTFALVMMIVNILLNLYPSLLQQQNKRQIDKMLKRFG